MLPHYRPATALDAADCIRVRGLTRENALSAQQLAELGITEESWSPRVQCGDFQGFVCVVGTEMAGFCFGCARSAEVLVLAVLPAYEEQGIGRHLLALVVAQLRALGHQRLFLSCSADPLVRSYGFYRRLGWQSAGTFDHLGDEVLELLP